MSHSLPPRATAVLLALVLALLAFRLGAVPLVGPDEPRYTRVAVEMHRAGEWVRPTLQGEPWLEKTPLFYWLAGGAFSVLGETEAAARVPSVLAALLLVGATALFGARLYGSAAGLHAGFVAGTSLLPFAYARAASMDMLLAATVTVAIGLLALRLLGIAGRLAIVAAAAAAGLATLAKGPLGLLLPILVVGGYVVATREWRCRPRAPRPAGDRRVPGRGRPLVRRDPARPGPPLPGRLRPRTTTSSASPRRSTTTPARSGTTSPSSSPGSSPGRAWRCPPSSASAPRASRSDLFVLLWLGLPLVFFSLAGSKLPGYILPCVPPLAILMGRAADRLITGPATPERMRSGRVVALVGLVLAALVAAAPAALCRASRSRCGARPSRSGCGRWWWPSSSPGASAQTPPGPSGCCGSGPPACSSCSRSPPRRSSRGGSRASGSSSPRWGATCWPGARGGPRGWPATSTTTGRCARSKRRARSSRRSTRGRRSSSRARPSGAGSRRWALSRCTPSPAGRGRTRCCAWRSARSTRSVRGI